MALTTTEASGEHTAVGHSGDHVRAKRSSSRATSPTSKSVASGDQTPQELPRAASYTYLPQTRQKQYGSTAIVDIQVFAKPGNPGYVTQSGQAEDISCLQATTVGSSGRTTPDDFSPSTVPPRTQAITAPPQQSLSTSPRAVLGAREGQTAETSALETGSGVKPTGSTSTLAPTPDASQLRPSVNNSFTRLISRNSWHLSTPSRSPSPSKSDTSAKEIAASTTTDHLIDVPVGPSRKSSISRRFTTNITKERKDKDGLISDRDQDPEKRVTRTGTFLRRKSAQYGLAKATAIDKNAAKPRTLGIPAVPSLPKSFSTDRLPGLESRLSIEGRAAPLSKLVSTSKAHYSSPLRNTKRTDELWGVFRSLDADYAKFSAKSSALKPNLVRDALIPFLRTYAAHPSSDNLRLEDLDRRTTILNKWWTGLVEMLHGHKNQSISGTDRPVILEGLLGIMERSEWRSYPSPFCPLGTGVKEDLGNGNHPNNSRRSSPPNSVTDSVHQNVQNIFIQNLSSQMELVVDKMSLRNVPSSLATFCGKACAYAFMFVPGMADILVRLWDLPMDTFRRVLQENGIGKFDEMPASTSATSTKFPPALHSLAFTSLVNFVRKLRTPPSLPPGTTHQQWRGETWSARWSGRESDLFYVFVKQFHILATNYLPSSATKRDVLAAPGMLPIHAQILANLDATIHRDASQVQQEPTTGGPAATFDELFGEPDAVASAFHVPPTNAVRLMAENRLIMLVQDLLSERTAQHPVARELFAQSFNDLLQAATRGTSMFDQSACYTLLELLEESLVLLVRYEHSRKSEEALIDFDFWKSVFKKMIESENTMTEIRLYAFLYSVWSDFVRDSGCKTDLCMDLLLDPEVFESRFNHWCPMVRAYFMRLLCWRVARYDTEDVDGELQILEAVQVRLLETWSHYLYLRNKADSDNTLRPATNPCQPAPGRRLLIVRTDNPVDNAGSFLSLDGFIDSTSQRAKPGRKQTKSTSALDDSDLRLPSSSTTVDPDPSSRETGLGGLLRKIMGPKSRSSSREPPKPSPTPRRAEEVVGAAAGDGKASEAKTASQPDQKAQFRVLSFKFSLEMHGNSKQLPPMRVYPPRLPSPAQAYLLANSRNTFSAESSSMQPVQPRGESASWARYSGRALAEWTIVVGECHGFFERRKHEGAPSNRHVETPTLSVEVFKRPS